LGLKKRWVRFLPPELIILNYERTINTMKKYKLIKEYPGSPILGITRDSDKIKFPGLTFNETKDLLKNNPEFWKEVIEKDYEILSFISTKKHGVEGNVLTVKEIIEIRIKSNTPNCFNIEGYIENESGFWNIHSVKRLSDGEIFTVGDKCKWQGNGCSDTGIISYITLENNVIMISNGSCNFHLKFISHTKKPLFTTEDGVEIFEGDCNKNGKGKRLYQVPFLKGEDSWSDPFKPYHLLILNDHYFRNRPKESLIFSTKEAAEEYILKNKPCLSFNDISRYLNYNKFGVRYTILDIVKSKLK
jgi:hypothetical protein